MNEIPDIIESKIVTKEWDCFWNVPEQINALPEKELVIITQNFDAGSTEETQLQKMLQACTLTDEQYNVIKLKNAENISWSQIKGATKPQYILLLGITPEQLGIAAMFRLYTPNRFSDCIWICGPSLSDMEKQADAKKQLWSNGLKPVFVDKTVKA